MASGHVYKENGNWYTSIRHAGQRKRKMIGKNKQIAERILQKQLGDLALGSHGLMDDPKITLKDFAADYLAHKVQTMRPKSFERAKGIINGHLLLWLGRYFLFDLTTEKVVAYQTRRLQVGHVTNATVNREVSVLRNMLNVAVQWHKLKVNPLRDVSHLKEAPGRLRFLNLEEIHRLLDACPPPPHPLRSIILMALTTGMRRGEILTLKWDYVKLENRLLVLPLTKNNTVRVVPINDTLFNVLDAMPNKVGYVFGNGKPLTDIKRSFHTACKKAGIENFRFHDCRHTYASHLAMRGVPGRVLQDLLGHKTAAMTARYTHLAPAALQSAQKLLDGVVG